MFWMRNTENNFPILTLIWRSDSYFLAFFPGTYVSNSSSIKIKFVSDGSDQRGGFVLLLTSFHTGTCSATEFSCDTDRFELIFLPFV